MSYDHAIVVRGRKRKPDKIRALVAQVIAAYPGAQLLADDDEDDEADAPGSMEVRVVLPGRTESEIDGAREGRPGHPGGGSFQIVRLRRGYQLSTDSSADGNRDGWEALCSVMEEVAATLGKVVTDEEKAAEMIDETDFAEDAPAGVSVARVTLLDREGKVLEEDQVDAHAFLGNVRPGGLLASPFAAHPLLTDQGRFGKGGARLQAILHDDAGTAYRRYTWTLDGYGRIAGVDVEEIDR